jgi:hypothetical protein
MTNIALKLLNKKLLLISKIYFMKKVLALSMVAIFAMALMLTSCGKYDDGPKFSLSGKKGRVVNVWKKVKEIDNGVDLPVNPDWANESMELTKDNKVINTDLTGVQPQTETWAFDSKKENIIFTDSGFSITFKILRLKANEMWLEFTFGTIKSEYHYESK